MTIQDRYDRLIARRAPADERVIRKYAEAFEAQPGTTTKYLLGAMRAVDDRYTRGLVEQGNRIERQLASSLRDGYPGLEFRRQGSVSNLTHIRHYSDVDLLVFIDSFHTLQQPQVARSPYPGDPVQDLLRLRQRCVGVLRNVFKAVKIDDGGATAVKLLRSGSLLCDVDVVPCNWFNTNSYAVTGLERDRAVQVLDRERRERRLNSPFLFNDRLDEHDRAMRGIPRMLIRLLKTIKADIEEETGNPIDLSSFDICSIVYRLHRGSSTTLDAPLEILQETAQGMLGLARNAAQQSQLMVIDDSRKIFDSTKKSSSLSTLALELGSLLLAAVREHATGRLLTGAHLEG